MIKKKRKERKEGRQHEKRTQVDIQGRAKDKRTWKLRSAR